MLINPERSCLLVVDIQEKLVPAVHQHDLMIKNCQWLLEVADILEIPVLTSEQYPQGLGGTVEAIASRVPADGIMSKVHFSCAADDQCLEKIEQRDREQIIIVGMEAHVCVLQTALGLKAKGKEVFVVADAIGSRNPEDKALALERMRHNGLEVVSREMVAFEWMVKSGTETFKKISANYLR